MRRCKVHLLMDRMSNRAVLLEWEKGQADSTEVKKISKGGPLIYCFPFWDKYLQTLRQFNVPLNTRCKTRHEWEKEIFTFCNTSKCHLCKEADETMDYLIICCKKITQTTNEVMTQQQKRYTGTSIKNTCSQELWDHKI